MAQFADGHSSEREPVGLSKGPKPLNGFGDVPHGRRRRARGRWASRLFEQTCGIRINALAAGGGLAGELGLKLRRYIKLKSHGISTDPLIGCVETQRNCLNNVGTRSNSR